MTTYLLLLINTDGQMIHFTGTKEYMTELYNKYKHKPHISIQYLTEIKETEYH